MEQVIASRNNLASVLMGKNISFPWRGQRDVVILVPYEEWLAFIKKYQIILQYRKPLNYARALESDNDAVRIRYFLYDISWALYSELAYSSNVQKESTFILPHFDDDAVTVSLQEVLSDYSALDMDSITHYDNALRAITRNYYMLYEGMMDTNFGLVNASALSDWNKLAYIVCIYLQIHSSNKVATKKINIEWRI